MSSSEVGWVAVVAGARAGLVRYLTRVLGDPDLAEDLTQEACVRMAERPPPDDRALRGWLFTVATNLARDHLRVSSRRRTLLAAVRDHVSGDPPPAPDAGLERAETARRVRRALDRLGDKERLALLLREEGFTHREIATAVGTTTGSVGTLLARALEKVGRYLEMERER